MILIEFTLDNIGHIKVVKNIRLKNVEALIDRLDQKKLEISIKKYVLNGKVNKLL